MANTKIIMDDDYYAETIKEIADDVEHAIEIANIPKNDHGFERGSFFVKITWIDE